MSKWKLTTTPEAIAFANRSEGNNRRSFSAPEMVRRHELEKALQKFQIDLNRHHDYTAFATLVEAVYPIWRDEIVHEQTGKDLFVDWLGAENINTWHHITTYLTDFFRLTLGEEEPVVNNWLDRIEGILEISQYHYFINPDYYNTNFDIEDLKEVARRIRGIHTISYTIAALEMGFAPEEILNVNLKFYIPIGRYTPENLRRLAKKYTYKEINNLLPLFRMNTIRIPAFEDFEATLDAGLDTSKKFKKFVKNLGYSYAHPNLFREAALNYTQFTDADKAILTSDVATPQEVAAALLRQA